MSTPSIIHATKKIFSLMNFNEKKYWFGIVMFALCYSLLEVLTATTVVVFVQVLNQPEIGLGYLERLGIAGSFSPNKIIIYFSVIFGSVFVVKNLISLIETFYQNLVIQKMNCRFKNRFLKRFTHIDYNLFLTRNSIYHLSVVAGDVDQIFNSGMFAMAIIFSECIVFASLVVMIIAMNPPLALFVFLIGGILCLVIHKGLLPLFYKWGQKLQEYGILSAHNLYQFFQSFKEIILHGKEEAFIEKFQYYAIRKARIQAIHSATNATPRIIIEILFVGIFVMAVFYMCTQHDSPPTIMTMLGGYLYAGFRLMPGLNRIIGQLNNLKTVVPSVNRVYQEYHAIPSENQYSDIPQFKFTNSIDIKDVTFFYSERDKEALKNISLSIKKSERVGIVGETGSGKSTLVDMILGLLKPTLGEVSVDNQFTVSSKQWHQAIGYVPQTLCLIDDTIEANIAFGERPEEIDHARVRSSIEKAQLLPFIQQLPEGIKTQVGERGVRLSGGERQRIAIARALYRQPSVLIFDEATSALDNETEEKLMDTIRNVSLDRTVIMIAHRLSTLAECDRIIVMKNGKIDVIKSYADLITENKSQALN